jgi:hypothetical protein
MTLSTGRLDTGLEAEDSRCWDNAVFGLYSTQCFQYLVYDIGVEKCNYEMERLTDMT